jgi:hypothetical protein
VETLVCKESIHRLAYPFSGDTSGVGVRLCGVAVEDDSRSIGAGIYNILQTNFAESIFYELE